MNAPRTIAAILRVNHGGEHGAIAIYRAQILAARLTAPDLVPDLLAILDHEIRHRATFRDLMPSRGARPCRLLGLWSAGGAALGLMTGLMGCRAILTCTAAVERCVHRHLQAQRQWLAGRDDLLANAIGEIEAEELEHLAFADAGLLIVGPGRRLLNLTITLATEAVIALSTRSGSALSHRLSASDSDPALGKSLT